MKTVQPKKSRKVILINTKVYQICISSNINAGNILQNKKNFRK